MAKTTVSVTPAFWVGCLQAALLDVEAERHRQYAKWGLQTHPLTTWNTILSEEVGELAQAILRKHRLYYAAPERKYTAARKRIRAEAVQVAAVALAIVQLVDSGSA
jgi:NTP pyrophosphatase (non-canonical NTP hydrolase)